MNNPLINLQALRRTVARMPDEQKRSYHDAKKALQAVIDEHGDESRLALLELTLADAVKRGDA